jgi:hypothetical protein
MESHYPLFTDKFLVGDAYAIVVSRSRSIE